MYRAKVWNFVKSASFWDAFPNDRPRLTLTYGFLISRLIVASSCPAILQRNAHHSGAGVFTPHKQQSLLVIAGRWFPTIPRARVWPKKLTKPLFASFLTWTLLRFKFLILIFFLRVFLINEFLINKNVCTISAPSPRGVTAVDKPINQCQTSEVARVCCVEMSRL